MDETLPALLQGIPRPGDRAIAAVTLGAVGVSASASYQLMSGRMDPIVATAVGVAAPCAVAAVAWAYAWRAGRRSAGVERRVWRLFALGLASWALGILPYGLFLASGGDPTQPAAWSQAGFLLAYPFWYRALWLLRQPVIAESRRSRAEAWLVELAALAMVGIAVFGLLWQPAVAASQNAAYLVPSVLDLVLVAALYNALRRTTISHGTAFAWFGYAFLTLAATDAAINYLVLRGRLIDAGFAVAGYAIAMGLVAIAARRPIRVTEAHTTMGHSRTMVAAIALAIAAPAGALAPAAAQPFVWGLAAVLLWRLLALVRKQGDSDADPLSGLLDPRAFERHLAGVVQASSSQRPALLVAIELDGFAAWNAGAGFAAGDALVLEVAGELEEAGLPDGIWARIGPDRFAWLGAGDTPDGNRGLATRAREAACRNRAGLLARSVFVVVPQDAETASNALAAAEEALAAARSDQRPVLAFDRGLLDGAMLNAGYTASLRKRRARVESLLADDVTIQPVFQPIVDLLELRVTGHEALSRFYCEPSRPPDQWIAEADAVGLRLEVEVECVRRALAQRAGRPDGTYLSVNASPQVILDPALEMAMPEGSLDWLVIEITEHDQVENYPQLAARLALFRGRGALVAIDDAGAGHSSLRHVMQLRPDFVKIDRSLIRDVNYDAAKRALLRSMVALGKELGARVVAEGVETAEELQALRELGVPLAQGFGLARPARTFVRTVSQPEPAGAQISG